LPSTAAVSIKANNCRQMFTRNLSPITIEMRIVRLSSRPE